MRFVFIMIGDNTLRFAPRSHWGYIPIKPDCDYSEDMAEDQATFVKVTNSVIL